MSYQSRIPVDRDYVFALGQAFYNFTYLEWGIIWTVVKLSADGFASVPRGETAGKIAKALTRAIANTSPPLPPALRLRLVKLDERFRSAIKVRNQLLHAHPYTAPDGAQQLLAGEHKWTPEEIDRAAQQFEAAAIECNAIFHADLAKVRP